VATSRRRERELARRRFERRRQAELERRAQAKRRNTIIGAVLATVVVILIPVILIAVYAVGGSSSKKAKAAVTPNTSITPSTSATPAPPAPTKCATISPNPPLKGAPKFPAVTGTLKKSLVSKDLKTGHGRAAKAGDSLEVFYTGISCDTGKLFDSSYKSTPAQPFPVTPLGTAQVIPGWNQGLIGVKAGGVRELVIPASEAYGAAGSPPAIQGNDTLDFIVQVKSVKKGA
jgi:peptidylprolyl isomerase